MGGKAWTEAEIEILTSNKKGGGKLRVAWVQDLDVWTHGGG